MPLPLIVRLALFVLLTSIPFFAVRVALVPRLSLTVPDTIIREVIVTSFVRLYVLPSVHSVVVLVIVMFCADALLAKSRKAVIKMLNKIYRFTPPHCLFVKSDKLFHFLYD